MARVLPADLQQQVHTTKTALPDEVCQDILKTAEIIIEGRTGITLDYGNCTPTAKQAILLQASLGALDYLSRGTTIQSEAVSSFALGSLSVKSSQSTASAAQTSIKKIEKDIDILVDALQDIPFTVAESDVN